MSLIHLYRIFPNLARSVARKTSSATAVYNCIAWAANDTTRPWWPHAKGYFWPNGIQEDRTIEAFADAFATMGYEACEGPSQEPNYEKVAIYALGGNVTHMARLLDNGKWTSKIGELEDIEHGLDDLTSNHQNGYGEVVQILRRLIA